MLEALTFDFWGTLYHGAYGVEARIALLRDAVARHGQPRSIELLREAYQHVWEVVDGVWRNEHRSMSVDRWLREMMAFVQAELPETALADLRCPVEEVLLHEDGPAVIPGVRDVLPRLAERYPLGLISDVGLTPGRVLREFLRRDGFLPLFRVLTFSDEAGRTKPVPDVFLSTLAALDARPEHAAHIGDLPETDLAGARSVGMHAVLFLGASNREDGLAMADAAFDNYGELEALLAGLDGETA